MSNSIYLQGSEQVQNAAHTMGRAADTMQQSANNMEDSLQRFLRGLDALVERFEVAASKLENPNGK